MFGGCRHILCKSRPVVLNTFIRSSRSRLLSGKPFFEETALQEKNCTRSIPERLSQYFTDILINEGEKIIDEPIHGFIEQVPSLSEDLRKCLDHENKLFTVMSYDPILIDPRLYLHFMGDIPHELTKSFFERLLYHRCYTACWKHFSNNYNTLSDLEEFLELINGILVRQDQYNFAILDFIISLPSGLMENLHNQIIETIEYTVKPSFDINQILTIWQCMSGLKSIDALTEYHDSLPRMNFEVDTLYLKRLMELLKFDVNLKHQTIVDYMVNFHHITSQNGWVSLIFPEFESSTIISNLNAPNFAFPFISSVKYMIQKGASLNESDTLYILHSDLVKPYTIYSAYSRSTKKLNKHIINHLTNKLLSKPNELTTIYKAGMRLMEERLIIKVLHVLVPLQDNVDWLIGPLDKTIQEKIINEFLQRFTTKQLANLIITFKSKPSITRSLITTLTTSHQPTPELLINLASNLTSKQTLLELNRSTLLRAKIIHETFVTCIFNKIIALTLPQVFHGGDFDQQYKFATKRENFHNSMRAYCQTLSLLSPQELSQTLTILDSFMKGDTFYYPNDHKAIEYLTKILHRETFQFVKRRLSPNEFVLYINSLVEINQKNIYFKRWLFKSIVLQDFEKSIQLLDLPEIKFYLTDIISGIVNNEKLNGLNTLLFLLMFFDKLKEKGFEYTLKQRECYELVNICMKDSINPGDMKSALIKVLNGNDRNLRRVLKVIGRSEKFRDKKILR